MSCKRHKKSSFCRFFASHGLIFAQKSRQSKLHACNSSTSAHEEASTYAFRLRQACAETGRPPMAKRLPPTKLRTHLNNRLPLLLPIRTIPKKKFCPIFGVNLRILPISGACRPASTTPPSRRFFEALAWQACHSCHEGASAYAFRLRQACAETGRSPTTCDRGKEPRGLR